MKKHIILIFILCSISTFAFADHLIKAEKALEKIYPDATSYEEEYVSLSIEQIEKIEKDARINFPGSHSKKVIIYKAFENDFLLGYAFEDTVIGKWGPIHYLVGLNKDGVILKVMILDYDEIRGKPIAKRRFLKQYKGKNINDPLRLRKDIDGVTGATISSRSLTDGIRKIVHVFYLIKSE